MIADPIDGSLALRALGTPGGRSVMFTVRNGTNDADVCIALNRWGDLIADEYKMQHRELSGWAIDVGAHIGGLTIPLVLDHPNLRVVAVEAVPENAALLEDNARRNGVWDRIELVQAFAAAPGTKDAVCHYGYRHDPSANDGYLTAHRYIAQTWGARGEPEFAPTIPAISLDEILGRFGILDVSFLKIDCEGCEWAFFDTSAVRHVRTMIGEYHGGTSGQENPIGRLHELLDPTHDVTILDPAETVSGLFEATRR